MGSKVAFAYSTLVRDHNVPPPPQCACRLKKKRREYVKSEPKILDYLKHNILILE